MRMTDRGRWRWAWCLPVAAAVATSSGAAFAADPAVDALTGLLHIGGIESDWYRSLLGEFLRLQRDINRALTQGVAALKDGTEAGPLLAAMGIGFLYGAFHAAGPGHGKAVVVSYFLSRDASWLRGVWMGSQIAFFHVLSALVAVLVAHSVLKFSVTRPIDQLTSLKVISYGAIAAVGAAMLASSLYRMVRAGGSRHGACAHDHRTGETGLLSIAIGVIPCSGAVLVLVYALANDLIVSGILMTLCIAVGMALTLAAMGIATVLLRRRAIGAEPSPRRTWLRSGLSILGPAAITILGVVLLIATLSASPPPL